MDEQEFIDSIDGRFPYADLARALEVAAQGVRVSPNAAFMVVHEVCVHQPRSDAEKAACRTVLAYVERSLSHPLARVILPLAKDILDGRTLSVAEQINVMRKVSRFPDQYNALAIPLIAGELAKPSDEEPDRVYDEVVAAWRQERTGEGERA